ncbi:CHAT domain-domain-containing protein [Tuber borchii]|uniref:CHAT domain-domain-containing protein n=1 Tax=Tuber borchii TaxID=42251 RepID=A0A2T6ZP78_TUBBO|nr:CHAT domain-domain-containing protein [Tuber borchii]
MKRYDGIKNIDDLETAVGLFDKAINHPSATNDPNLPRYLNQYATALVKRFGINHNAEDLQKAITLVKKVFREVDKDDQNYEEVLGSASECLEVMYEEADSADALHEIIAYGKEALQSMPPEHPKRPGVFHMLSCCLRKRFTLANEFADIDDAVSYAGKAIEGTPEEENDKLASHFLLVSNCLHLRCGCWPDSDYRSIDIQYAVQYGEESVELRSLGNSLAPMALAMHAQCFHSKFEWDGSWKDLKESISLSYEAMDYGAASGEIDWKLSSELAYRLLLACKYTARLDRLLSCAVELLPRATLRPLGQDQQRVLSNIYSLATNAAAASLEAGNDPYEALRLLELGRSVLISMQLEAQMPIPELQKQHPTLADEYIKLHDQLRSSKITEEPFEIRHKITADLRNLLAEIHQKPGFDGFGKTLGKEEMMKLADRGPIVILNVSKFRCDAIAILSDEIKVISLPDLDVDVLGQKSLELQEQLAAAEDAQKDYHLLYKNLTEILKITWRQAMSPTLKALGFTKKPRDEKGWPHIWWIPTDYLCLVPVHAAGIPGKATVMDRVMSSYIPSIKTLAYARAKHQNSVSLAGDGGAVDRKDVRALVIAMADTPERTPLDHSELEAKAVLDSFPDTTILKQPTRQLVVAELENPPPIIHFSCHGETDYDDPTESKLLLSDWETSPLNVSQLQRLSLQGSKLAYLSACWAAHGGGNLELLNENIHLVSACQLAGFPSVIGSLWYVGQDASLLAVERFYKEIGKGGNGGGFDVLEAGRALHFAILGLRESTKSAGNDFKGDPVRWAPFVHFGI